jgi:hypothetical protein
MGCCKAHLVSIAVFGHTGRPKKTSTSVTEPRRLGWRYRENSLEKISIGVSQSKWDRGRAMVVELLD